MIKKCGNIRAWHFAHDWHCANEFQRKCSYETYLHGYAKRRLKQWFYESDAIVLHYKCSVTCKQYDTCNLKRDKNCSKIIYKSCDLKRQFSRCSIETSVKETNGNYRADLLLTSDTDTSRHILIEIKVSHGCTEKKKESNAKIIEFDVSSEEDVNYIISHDIKESEKVRYYGFKNLTKKDDVGIIPPKLKLQKFILYKSGKPFCKPTNCQSFNVRHPSSSFEITTKISECNYWQLNLYGLKKALDLGYKFSNCYLCEHNFYDKEKGCGKCEISHTVIEKGSYAPKCESYIFKSSSFDQIKELSLNVLDIWRNSSEC